MARKSSPQLQAKYFFLTYPQANNLDLEGLHIFLKSLDHVEKVVVSQEEHEEEGIHFHALVGFTKKIKKRNMNYFDLFGNHPNIQSPRNLKDVFNYVVKDGVFINDGWSFEEKKEISDICEEVCQIEGLSHNERMKLVVRQGKDRALKVYHAVDTYMQVLQKPSAKFQPLRPLDEFKMEGSSWSDAINTFMADVEQGCGLRGLRKSLWLYGESRMGKTMLARSLGVHWYMNGMWNVDCYDDDAAYGVLDDIAWENMNKYYKGLLGMQQDITVTDKYKKKSVIKHGKPVIVITNELPNFTQEEMAWLNVNVEFCGVFSKCYKEEEFRGEAQNPFIIRSSQ